MKAILLLSLLSFSPMSISFDFFQDIVVAMQTGNAKEISKYFSPNIDIAILEKEDVYSRVQAEMIIKEFFETHPPKSFTIIYQGTSKAGVKYGIGSLVTGKGKFRVTFYIKEKDARQFIQQMRIDVDE